MFTLSLSGKIRFDQQFPSRVTCSNAYLLRKTRTNLVISSKNRWIIGKNKTLDTNVRRLTRVTKKSIELRQFHSFIWRYGYGFRSVCRWLTKKALPKSVYTSFGLCIPRDSYYKLCSVWAIIFFNSRIKLIQYRR